MEQTISTTDLVELIGLYNDTERLDGSARSIYTTARNAVDENYEVFVGICEGDDKKIRDTHFREIIRNADNEFTYFEKVGKDRRSEYEYTEELGSTKKRFDTDKSTALELARGLAAKVSNYKNSTAPELLYAAKPLLDNAERIVKREMRKL